MTRSVIGGVPTQSVGTVRKHVYATAQAAGCSRVHWLTHETNAKAKLFYERIGERSGFEQYRKTF